MTMSAPGPACAVEAPASRARSVLRHVQLENLAAGLSGGVVSTLVLHPLDLVKIRFAGEAGTGRGLCWLPEVPAGPGRGVRRQGSPRARPLPRLAAARTAGVLPGTTLAQLPRSQPEPQRRSPEESAARRTCAGLPRAVCRDSAPGTAGTNGPKGAASCSFAFYPKP